MRGPRISYPHAVLHVINRFVDRHPFFKHPKDYELFLDIYFEVAGSFGLWTYAYCLMPNHFHIVLETPSGEISRFLQRFLTRVAKQLNRRRNRVGHLFQGRSKTLVVETDEYLSTVVGYVLTNPVRSGLSRDVFSYRWNSVGEMLKGKSSKIARNALWGYLFDQTFDERRPKASLEIGKKWLEDMNDVKTRLEFEEAHRGGFLSDATFRRGILNRLERRKSKAGGKTRRTTDRYLVKWDWEGMAVAADEALTKNRRSQTKWRGSTAARQIRWYIAHEGACWTWDRIRASEEYPGAPISRFSMAVSRIKKDSEKKLIADLAIRLACHNAS